MAEFSASRETCTLSLSQNLWRLDAVTSDEAFLFKREEFKRERRGPDEEVEEEDEAFPFFFLSLSFDESLCR